MLDAGMSLAASRVSLSNHPAVSPELAGPTGPVSPFGPGTATTVGAEQNWVTQQLRADGRIAAMLPYSIGPVLKLASLFVFVPDFVCSG